MILANWQQVEGAQKTRLLGAIRDAAFVEATPELARRAIVDVQDAGRWLRQAEALCLVNSHRRIGARVVFWTLTGLGRLWVDERRRRRADAISQKEDVK